MGLAGSTTPEFREAMAASFHVVTSPSRILARVGRSSLREPTPGRLNATPMANPKKGLWVKSAALEGSPSVKWTYSAGVGPKSSWLEVATPENLRSTLGAAAP